jgi:signal transduction histidine kinase
VTAAVVFALLSLAAGAALVRERRRAAIRAELVACAAHELRGPLAAAHLALQGVARQAGIARWRVAAVDVQLQRAALAVADLAAAPHGNRAADRAGLGEVGELL